MNNYAAFYEAAVPEPHTILGLRLRPFSLGHKILLNRIGNGFVSTDPRQPITYDDLASAVFVCAQTWQQNIESLHDLEETARFMDAWQKTLIKKRGRIDLYGGTKLFRAYYDEGNRLPEVKFTPGDPLDVPFEQIVKVTLLSEFNFTEAELMDRSWRLCVFDYLTRRAINGDLEFVDHDDIDQLVENFKKLLTAAATKKKGAKNGRA